MDRTGGEPGRVSLPPRTARVRFSTFTLDLDGCSLSGADSGDVPLTPKEFSLLREFVQHPGRVLSRDYLLDALTGKRADPFDRSVDVLVGRLRRKIEPDAKRPALIVTVPGEGYKFAAAPRNASIPNPTATVPQTGIIGTQEHEGRHIGAVSEEAVSAPLALPDKPSIAVLPFQNMSGDPEQDYFAEGMAEELVTGLSRIKWLFIIARNSSAVYKSKSVDARQVGRELGVRYLLDGGVRKAGSRVRITAQLIEAESGTHLWADKFDGRLEDVFDLQDQITDRVVGIVEPSVRRWEIDRSRRKRPDNLDAYDLYLRALPHLASISTISAPIAGRLLQAALRLDPKYPAAHAYLAWSHQISFTHGGFKGSDKAEGLIYAHAAIANDVDDATALAVGAMVVGLLGKNASAALDAIERALSFNPSSAAAHYFGAQLYAWSGDPITGVRYAHRALRLSPFDPLAYAAHLALGIAAFHDGRYDEAAVYWGKCAQANPGFGAIAMGEAFSLALAGRMAEARAIFARAMELEPGFGIRTILELGYIPAIADKFVRAARLLGAQE